MATLAPQYSINPRASTETDRRHLLADSVAPSETSSVIESFVDGDRTPRAASPARSLRLDDSSSQLKIPAAQSHERRGTIADPTPAPQPYRGFPSEAHYLAALREWAEEQKYLKYDTVLHGFFGSTTMEEYASRPGPELHLKKKWKARKARKAEEKKGERRNTVA